MRGDGECVIADVRQDGKASILFLEGRILEFVNARWEDARKGEEEGD